VPAYNNVKVWEIDPETLDRTRPARVRGSARPEGRTPSDDSRERYERNEKLSVWARLAVVTVLAVAVLFWPYDRSCGFGLTAYLAATTMIIVGGIWVVACTWICRMARTHAVAILLALWGAALITVEVLPRIGYARVQATWLC
jgi:hypothetical protein